MVNRINAINQPYKDDGRTYLCIFVKHMIMYNQTKKAILVY